MNESDALRAGAGVLARAPASVLPFYLVVAATVAAARVPLLAAVGVALALLAAQGRLGPVLRRLADLDPAAPAAVEAAGRAVAGLVTPPVALLVATGVLFGAGVYLLLRGPAGAGAVHAVWAVLDGRPPAVAGVRGVRADWRPFLGLRLLRTALLVPAGGLAVVGVGAVGLGPAGVLAGLLLLALSALLAAGATLALAFAAPAVVVDGVGTWTAVRRSVATYRDRPRTGVAYVVVLAGLVAGGGAVALGLAAAGVPRVVGLVATLAVPPVLDGVKTALYADRPLPPRDGVTGTGGTATTPAGAADLPPAPSPGPVARLAAGLRRGLGRLGAFVRTHPGAVAAGAGVFAAAGALVYATVAGYGVALDVPGDAAGAFGEFPVALFLDVAANNWLVAATGAYGGLAAGLPTVAALAFNGALVGGLVAVVPARATLGLVVPHAVVELPALAVAGGLGLHLGRVGVGALRGRASDETVAAELTEAFRVLVGLGVLFVVAAFVEAFVTPRVAAALLG